MHTSTWAERKVGHLCQLHTWHQNLLTTNLIHPYRLDSCFVSFLLHILPPLIHVLFLLAFLPFSVHFVCNCVPFALPYSFFKNISIDVEVLVGDANW